MHLSNDPNLLAGLRRLAAIRVADGVCVSNATSLTHPYAYLAEETDSWWLITTESVVELGRSILEHDLNSIEKCDAYADWAEADSSAVEYGPRRPNEAPRLRGWG